MASTLWVDILKNFTLSETFETIDENLTLVEKTRELDANNIDRATLGPVSWGSGDKMENDEYVSSLLGPFPPGDYIVSDILHNTNEVYLYYELKETRELMQFTEADGSDTYYILFMFGRSNYTLTFKDGTTKVFNDGSDNTDIKIISDNSKSAVGHTWIDAPAFQNALIIKLIKEEPISRVHIILPKVNTSSDWDIAHTISNGDTIKIDWDFFISYEDISGLLYIPATSRTATHNMKKVHSVSDMMRNRGVSSMPTRVASPRQSTVEVITKTTLWKEVRYSRDILLKYKFGNKTVKKGGFGYQFAYSKFTTENLIYTYTMDGVEVTAHTTTSLNGLMDTNQNGVLPTDFEIDSLACIQNGTRIYVDYWDDTDSFKNLVYIRDLNANMATTDFKQVNYNNLTLDLPIGTVYPIVQGGYKLRPLGVTISTQFTDSVAVNSLRFMFEVYDATQSRVSMMYFNGVPSCFTNWGAIDVPGRYSFISLIPSNDDYQTPIASSSTVRKDLEMELDVLRQEFNDLAYTIALNQVIELATMPIEMMSAFSSIKSVVQSLSKSFGKIAKRFTKTTKFSKMSNLDELTNFKIPRPTLKTETDSINWESVGILDDITIPLNLGVTGTVKFDDVTASLLAKTVGKGKFSDDAVAELVAEVADKSIKYRTYRIFDEASDTVFEFGDDIVAYNAKTLNNVPLDLNKFRDLLGKSKVIDAIIDLRTLKAVNQGFGKIDFETTRKLIMSNPDTIREMTNNPIILKKLKDILSQAMI